MIPGTVPIGGPLAPTDLTDRYPTHDALYGKGGWRNVILAADRDAIPAERRVVGMVVGVIEEGKTYQLNAEPWAYDVTDWTELVFNPSTDIFYTNLNPVPVTLGGIIAGTTFDHVNITGVMDMLLYPQLTPAFSYFHVDGYASMAFDVGHVFPSGSHLFQWHTTNGAYVVLNSVSIYDYTGGVTLATGLANDGSESIVIPYAITKTVKANHSFRVRAENTSHVFFAGYMTMSWLWRRYVGNSMDPMLDEAGIEALTTSNALTGSVGGTFSFTSPGYKYFAIPTSSGAATVARDTGTNLNVAMADASDGYGEPGAIGSRLLTLTNVNGYSHNYRIYRTKHVINGSMSILIG